jgi:hypothetical protein
LCNGTGPLCLKVEGVHDLFAAPFRLCVPVVQIPGLPLSEGNLAGSINEYERLTAIAYD